VVRHGEGGGLYLSVAGIGVRTANQPLGMQHIEPGDAVRVSGPVGDHGIAVMLAREQFGLSGNLQSDSNSVLPLARAVWHQPGLKFMRDPTRGGLACVLVDLMETANLTIEVNEADIPVGRSVMHASELLGLDPLTVANEGKCVIILPGSDAASVLKLCKAHPLGKNARMIGHLTDRKPSLVELISGIGGRRIIQRPYGEQLPRIC
jgi:hydrogenase expression/formation protein HypE